MTLVEIRILFRTVPWIKLDGLNSNGVLKGRITNSLNTSQSIKICLRVVYIEVNVFCFLRLLTYLFQYQFISSSSIIV